MKAKISVKKNLIEYAIITIAVLIMDIGIYVFKFPNNFTFGGVSGMSVVISKMLSLSATQTNIVISLLLLVAGFAVLGRNFGMKTAYVTVISSVLLSVMEKLFPISSPLTDQIMIELCFAILLPAIASAMLFHLNASSGGTDIIAMIIRKYSTMDISMALLSTDLVVVVISFFVFDITTGLCSVLGLLSKTLLIDKSIERMKLNKYFTIIATDPEPICDYIRDELHRSATLYHAMGNYSHKDRTIILTVVDVRQAVLLERFIKDKEPDAFMLITKSSEVIGKGFVTYI